MKYKIEQIKNKVSSMSSNPMMDSINTLNSLKSQLANEQSYYNQGASQNSILSTQLSQAKTNFSTLQKQDVDLQNQKKQQEALVFKMDSYLNDFQDSLPGHLHNEELAEKLAGELNQLNVE